MTEDLRLQTDAAKRRRDWIELGVVAAFYVLPGTVDLIVPGDPDVPSFLSMTVTGTAHSIGMIALFLYLMWRSGDGWSFFGVCRFRPVRDIGLGLILTVVCLVLMYGYDTLLYAAFSAAGYVTGYEWEAPSRPIDYLLLLVFDVSNAAAEELAMRGLVLARLHRLLGSAPKAILFSSIAFAAYHAYYGLGGMIAVFVTGVLLAGAVVAFRTLWPAVIAHAAGNMCYSVLAAS